MKSEKAAPARGRKLYEGKAKILYELSENEILHEYKDSATAFNGKKKETIAGKGALNTSLTSMLFGYLATQNIRSHFVRQESENSIVTIPLQMLPVEVVVRNRLAGSLARRLQEEEGQVISPPLVEWFLKDDLKDDPQVSRGILQSLYGILVKDLDQMEKLAIEVNIALRELFDQAKLELVDFKLEFGKTSSGEVVLGDEISPDTCRLWDKDSGEKLDKDRFRLDLGDLLTGYREIHTRLERLLRK